MYAVIARIFKYTIGALLFLLGLGGVLVEGEKAVNGEWQDPFFGIVLTVSFFTLAVFAFLAARSHFRGGWRSGLGTCIVAVGFLFLAHELDNFVSETQQDPLTGVAIGIMCLVAGTLLIRSGLKAHANDQETTAGA
jgi:divalent metal cation (Fe/Co/Zn/Cd) transporter